jgi:hypothetical protein
MLEKESRDVNDCIGLAQEGSCESGNELSGSMKSWEVFQRLYKWRPLQ